MSVLLKYIVTIEACLRTCSFERSLMSILKFWKIIFNFNIKAIMEPFDLTKRQYLNNKLTKIFK